ncbi:MAG TPA: hypothetical protein VHC44_16135 [Verrucomicrobiae bacterium]|nr:hypothetical protein [Verrucomicrobiae bacterium]
MKTALAFVCSLMLAWTNVVLAATDAGVVSAAPSCHCGRKTGCCAAKHSAPESQPVSAAPVTSFQNQFSLIAPATVAWALPGSPEREVPSPVFSSFQTTGTALFAWNCARLI